MCIRDRVHPAQLPGTAVPPGPAERDDPPCRGPYVLGGPESVSYTHLDVYKRQGHGFQRGTHGLGAVRALIDGKDQHRGGERLDKDANAGQAVEHDKDVYKRQAVAPSEPERPTIRQESTPGIVSIWPSSITLVELMSTTTWA